MYIYVICYIFALFLQKTNASSVYHDLIVSSYDHCKNSTHCSEVFNIQLDNINDNTKYTFFKNQIEKGLELFDTKDRDRIDNMSQNVAALKSSSALIMWAVTIGSINEPYCNKVNGETIRWSTNENLPSCECLIGACHNGPYDNSILYVMFILLIIAILMHVIIDVWTLITLKKTDTKLDDITPSQRKMALSSIGISRARR